MKKTLFLFALLIVVSPVVSFAQDETDRIFDRVKTYTSSAEKPAYVLKVDDKTLVFDNEKKNDLSLEKIDPNTIQELKVLKGVDALAYSETSKSVIVITFKNFEKLPPSLKKKFEAL